MKTLTQLMTQQNWPKIRQQLRATPVNSLTAEEAYALGLSALYGTPKELELATQSLQHAAHLARNIKTNNLLAEIYLNTIHAYHIAEQWDKAYDTAKLAIQKTIQNTENFKAFSEAIKTYNPKWQAPLQSQRLTLIRLGKKHFSDLLSIRKNTAFQQRYNRFKDSDQDRIIKDLERSERPPLVSGKIEWLIQRHQQTIGIAGLVDLDPNNKRAELQIGFTGDKPPGLA
ncbi:MAG: hypothetical protein ACP5D0_09875, partial [Hydrogenovibrio sp.]